MILTLYETPGAIPAIMKLVKFPRTETEFLCIQFCDFCLYSNEYLVIWQCPSYGCFQLSSNERDDIFVAVGLAGGSGRSRSKNIYACSLMIKRSVPKLLFFYFFYQILKTNNTILMAQSQRKKTQGHQVSTIKNDNLHCSIVNQSFIWTSNSAMIFVYITSVIYEKYYLYLSLRPCQTIKHCFSFIRNLLVKLKVWLFGHTSEHWSSNNFSKFF